MKTDTPGIPGAIPWPTVASTRYAMVLLTIIYMLNFLDRQIINILAESIKAELMLSDTQLGLLTGFSFALIYTVFGLPIARLADRGNRKVIISVAVFFWSLMTAVCGLAQSFVQLLMARMSVAAGESGCTPPAHSMIADYVPPTKRATALAIYSLGIPLGTLCGMALGGWIAHSLNWRMAFFVAAAPGILLALIALFTLKEPQRRTASHAAAFAQTTFVSALLDVWRGSALRRITIAMSLLALLGYGQAAFLASFFLRVHEVPLDRLGLALGLVLGFGGIVGTWVGGWLADRSAQKDAAAFVSVPALGAVIACPAAVASFLVPQTELALALLFVSTMLNSLWFGPAFAAIQMLVKAEMRAVAVAAVTLIITLIGLGIGPVLVGMISDAMNSQLGAGNALRLSLLLVTLMGPIAGAMLYFARGPLRRELTYS